MSHCLYSLILSGSISVLAPAQAGFLFRNLGPTEPACPRINNREFAAHSFQRGNVDVPPPRFIPVAERVRHPNLAVLGIDGVQHKVDLHRGKLVVVGIWDPACDASLRQLQELHHYQRQEGTRPVVVLPVHSQAWPHALAYLRRKKEIFDGIRVFKAGIGNQGFHLIFPEVAALPANLVFDREGRLAAQWYGYLPNHLTNLLNTLLQEIGTEP